MRKFYVNICLVFLTLASFAQTFTDGPIQLQIRLRDVRVGFNETDASLLGVGFSPDEPVVHCWAQDNANLSALGWQGGVCHTFSLGTGAPLGLPGISPEVNELMFNYIYPPNTVIPFY